MTCRSIVRVLPLVVSFGLAAACAVGAEDGAGTGVPGVDSGTKPKDAGTDRGSSILATDAGAQVVDAAVPQVDAATAKDSGSVTPVDSGVHDSGTSVVDASTPDSGPPTGCSSLRINEVQTAGATAADEFIEIYNTSATLTVSTSGCKLVYRSASGAADIACLSATYTIPPKGFAVFAGGGFPGAKTGPLGCQLAGASGQVGLFDGATAVDTMGYGTVTAPAPNFVKGATAAPSPATSHSVGRTPDGHDTGVTGADFVDFAAPTPGAAN